MAKFELKDNTATFMLRDYLTPGGRYPYSQLSGDLEATRAKGHDVVLLSVPGFMVLIGFAGKGKKPWSNDGRRFTTAAQAIRG